MWWSAVLHRLTGHTSAACWFCHENTRLPPTADPHDWFCTHCKNHNTRDAAGNIVDARDEMFREAPAHSTPRRQAVISLRSGDEDLLVERDNDDGDDDDDAKRASVFCTTCQRNQELVRQILASYLPDEDDTEYAARAENADEYAASLRRRYPVVCRSCQGRVDRRLQIQAQAMYRRHLASALARSEVTRTRGPRAIQTQPSLRRKPVVVVWLVCALVALVACPLAACLWYYLAITMAPPPAPTPQAAAAYLHRMALAGFALAMLTYATRHLNPMWLYVACNPGMRVSGLPLYKRRLARLAGLRAAAALLLCVQRHQRFLSLLLLAVVYDLALTVLAAKSIRTSTGKRLWMRRQSSSKDGGGSNVGVDTPPLGHDAAMELLLSPTVASNAAGGHVPDPPLTSFERMSFGPSEFNRDQDDSFWDAGVSDMNQQLSSTTSRRYTQRQTRPRFDDGFDGIGGEGASSGDDETSTINTEIVSGLDTLSFGASPRSARSKPFSRKESAEAMDVDVLLASGFMGNNNNNNNNNNSNGADQMLQRRGAGGGSGLQSASGLGPRPFEAFRFHRDIHTGLESKLSAFSIDDTGADDDGSYQGLFGSHAMDSRLLGAVPRAIALSLRISVALCVVYLWLWDARTTVTSPLWYAWPVRAALVVALLSAATAAATKTRRKVVWIIAAAGLLLALLIGIPVLYTFQWVNVADSKCGSVDLQQMGVLDGHGSDYGSELSAPVDRYIPDPALVEPNNAQWLHCLDWPDLASSVLLRWPRAKRLASRNLWCMIRTRSRYGCDVTAPNGSYVLLMPQQQQHLPPSVVVDVAPLLGHVDLSAEVAALLFIAFA
ncbi:hypothetical protein GGI11_002362 [Coemansia sp. RSA 2049]|nr:hypothetical protein GGI11_002362 [Coemansia sp. RSA 2049]